MLNDEDQVWLVRQLVATAEVLGTEIRPAAAAMMAEDLSRYDRSTLGATLARVRSDAPTRLTLKVVMDAIDAMMGRPAANEAWAVALSALDDRNTVIWTGEMARAWETARLIAQAGDLIGARMAFIAAYDRLVREARDMRLLPEVIVSEGWDASTRALAVEKAMALGYTVPENARPVAYLSAPAAINVLALTNDTAEVATATAAEVPGLHDRLRQLRADLTENIKRKAQEKAERAAAAAADLAARKAYTQSMADAHIDPAAEIRAHEWAVARGQAQGAQA